VTNKTRPLHALAVQRTLAYMVCPHLSTTYCT